MRPFNLSPRFTIKIHRHSASILHRYKDMAPQR